MSKERIDLTQFEGISKGKWEHDGGEIHAEEAERNNSIIAQYPSWNYNVKDNDGLLTVEDASNLIAMAAVPDLIAELQRYYGLHDAILGTLSDYDINELIRDVPEDEWNFEQRTLVRIKELVENKASE